MGTNAATSAREGFSRRFFVLTSSVHLEQGGRALANRAEPGHGGSPERDDAASKAKTWATSFASALLTNRGGFFDAYEA